MPNASIIFGAVAGGTDNVDCFIIQPEPHQLATKLPLGSGPTVVDKLQDEVRTKMPRIFVTSDMKQGGHSRCLYDIFST